MLSKPEAIRRHAFRRAEERYGIRLTDEIHDEIVEEIKKRASRGGGIGKKITCRRWRVLVERDGKRIWLMYDRKRELILTFLKPEWVDQDKGAPKCSK